MHVIITCWYYLLTINQSVTLRPFSLLGQNRDPADIRGSQIFLWFYTRMGPESRFWVISGLTTLSVFVSLHKLKMADVNSCIIRYRLKYQNAQVILYKYKKTKCREQNCLYTHRISRQYLFKQMSYCPCKSKMTPEKPKMLCFETSHLKSSNNYR